MKNILITGGGGYIGTNLTKELLNEGFNVTVIDTFWFGNYLHKHKNLKILIPGAGNAYEAEYLIEKGFANVYILDISEIPLKEFQQRNPEFPSENLLCDDFFNHTETYDLIFEQTFFCSFPPLPKTRKQYASVCCFT